jgi:hypothetical protein
MIKDSNLIVESSRQHSPQSLEPRHKIESSPPHHHIKLMNLESSDQQRNNHNSSLYGESLMLSQSDLNNKKVVLTRRSTLNYK